MLCFFFLPKRWVEPVGSFFRGVIFSVFGSFCVTPLLDQTQQSKILSCLVPAFCIIFKRESGSQWFSYNWCIFSVFVYALLKYPATGLKITKACTVLVRPGSIFHSVTLGSFKFIMLIINNDHVMLTYDIACVWSCYAYIWYRLCYFLHLLHLFFWFCTLSEEVS